MREIKFRAFDLTLNGWIIGWLVKDSIIDLFDLESVYENIAINSIGQYTGLKDINNKKIYDGDIVYIHYIDKKKIAKVKLDLVWGVSLICDEELDEDKIKERAYERLEVIGNIYENQELLEEMENEDKKIA